MSIITTISITRQQSDLALQHHLSWTEAARVGMGIILADLGILEYESDLNLHRKMNIFRKKAEEANQKLAELEAKK